MTNAFGISQSHYRFAEENGTEATSTLLGSEDTALSRDVTADSNIQLRILTAEVGGGSIAGGTNATWQLQRKINAGAFANVTNASTGAKANTGSALTDGSATTSRLTPIGTFSAGQQDDQNGAVTYTHPANLCTEHVFGLTLVAADLANGDAVTFQLLYNGAAFTTTQNGAYTVTPTLNISKPTFNSGDGTAAGVGNAAGVGSSFIVVLGDGTTAGTGAAAAVGSIVLSGAGDAAGLGDAVGVGSTVGGGVVNEGDGATAGVGAATGAGAIVKTYLPNAVIAATNLKDTSLNSPPTDLTDIQDDPASPDGDWYTAVDTSADTMLHLGFFTPEGNLISGQSYPIRVRKTSGAGNPTVRVDLYENGAFVATLVSPQTVTAGAPDGEEVLVPWDASLLSDQTGVNAEIRIIGTAS